jgi:hypothetical protein
VAGAQDEESPTVRASELKVDVNASVRELAERLEGAYLDGEPWSFVCECAAAGCRERVPLTLASYEKLRRRGRAVLAPGHVLPAVERARRRARELSDEAAALRAQATQQAKRARQSVASARRSTQAPPEKGRSVWVDGRRATFLYSCGDCGAAVRYRDENATRVVAVGKLALRPPRER